MAALPIAILFEGEYPQFAAKLPGLSPSHAAYVKSTARKEVEWKATEGHTTILVPVSLADLDAYLAAGRARNPTALTVLALEKANRLLPLKAADCTLVRVTMHTGWERPTTTIWGGGYGHASPGASLNLLMSPSGGPISSSSQSG